MKIGMFDENIFLYDEEFILATKLQRLGRKTGITKEARFLHEHIHPSTQAKKLESSLREALMTRDSHLYYFVHYLTDSRLLCLAYTFLNRMEKLKIYLRYIVKRAFLAMSTNT